MTEHDPIEILKQGLDNLAIAAPDTLIQKFRTYNAELCRWNHRYGFINTNDPAELYIHMLDALSGLPMLKEYGPPSPLLDFGSGAGLPGLPLAFCLPDIPVILCERKSTEASFLRNMVLITQSSHITVIDDIREIDGFIGCAAFRAVKTIKELLPILSPYIRKDGIIFAYKATRARIDAERHDLETEYKKIMVRELKHPDPQRERHAVVLFQKDRIVN